MQFLSRIKYILVLVITITAVVVFAFVLVNATMYAPNDDEEPPPGVEVVPGSMPVQTVSAAENVKKTVTPLPTPIPDNYPVTLVIPKISVHAHVQYVGVTWKGTLGSPNNFTDVAWYKSGTVPGENGTAVIDGHLDNGLGLNAVFKHLSDLAQGDEVDVLTKGGQMLRFVVSQVSSYDYNDPAGAVAIFSPTDTSTLRLVTCDGDWVQAQKTYNRRLVVTAQVMAP